MRTGRAFVLMAMLAVLPICVFAASYASHPNPVGEIVYRPRLLLKMLPIGVFVCAILVGWLFHAVHRRDQEAGPRPSRAASRLSAPSSLRSTPGVEPRCLADL